MISAWSPSAAWSYWTCPRRFWLEYVHRASSAPPGVSLARGRVLHAGLAAGWAAISEGLPPLAVTDRVDEAMGTEVDHCAGDGPDEREYGRWLDTAERVLGALGPRPGDELLAVEATLHGEQDGVALKVRPDLVFRRGGRLTVWDWKSSSTLPRPEDVRQSTQLGVGGLLAARQWAATEVRVGIASVGSAVVVDTDLPRETALAAARRIVAVAHRAEADTDFVPVQGEVCATCSVRSYCPLFASDPIPEPENTTTTRG